MTSKNRYIILVIGIISLGLLLVGGTYAFLTFAATITNATYDGTSTCFDITYDSGETIEGVLFQSSTPDSGLSGVVNMKIDASCSSVGTGTIFLNVDSVTGTKLFETVSAHCENEITLKTITGVTTASDCKNQTNGRWVTLGTALKYAVYVGTDTVPVDVGHITKSGDIKLYSDFNITQEAVDYNIYVWLDGNLADSSYVNIPFSGYIHASATQT